jgi:DNA repair exonuclease SbcCD ATPase subunit
VPLPGYETGELRHNHPIGTDETRNELEALERELQAARQAAEESQAALSALEEQRREREGRLSLAVRAREDLERHLEMKREELARAEAEAALEAFKRALEDRDVAAEAFASAAKSVVSRLQDFDAAQEGAEQAWQALVQSYGPTEARVAAAGIPGGVQAQHDVFIEALTTLIETVTPRADDEFERNLVEAAARSPLGNDISNLPTHLQGLARARYFEIAREGRRGRLKDA